jgi:hypothetical protein
MYKAGDIVKFKSVDDTKLLKRQDFVTCGWNEKMNYLCEQERVLTEETAGKLNGKACVLWTEMDKEGIPWYISRDMIELVD